MGKRRANLNKNYIFTVGIINPLGKGTPNEAVSEVFGLMNYALEADATPVGLIAPMLH